MPLNAPISTSPGQDFFFSPCDGLVSFALSRLEFSSRQSLPQAEGTEKDVSPEDEEAALQELSRALKSLESMVGGGGVSPQIYLFSFFWHFRATSTA